MAPTLKADLVLSGGGVLGVGHAGAAAVLEEHGYTFPRVAGTSAGAIIGSLLAAGMSTRELAERAVALDYRQFLDQRAYERVPVLGPAASVVLQNGVYRGDALREWIAGELEALGVRTFGDLRIDDPGSALVPAHRYRLVVTAADVTRGELVRLPWDYARYGLDPDAQPVADAVRASTAVPYVFEPQELRHADGSTSLLVDGGVLSNYPLDIFDRTDFAPPRWPTFGVTLFPRLPAGLAHVLPPLGPLGNVPSLRYLESVIATVIAGRDQGYLAQPWVAARSMEVDGLGVNPLDFDIDPTTAGRLEQSGRAAAEHFLAGWDWTRYRAAYRRPAQR